MTQLGTQKAPKTGNALTYVGLGASVLWLVGGTLYLMPRLTELSCMSLNEVGDFLAGGFAPLAFFWLVLGFFQQGSELRTSNQALWLQGEELRNSVEQQRELVAATREGISAEADRLATERTAAHERAQPLLELKAEGWGSDGQMRNQSLAILNHGESCTGVTVSIDGGSPHVARDMLQKGDRIGFKIDVPADLEFPPVRITVVYIDTLKKRGSVAFDLAGVAGALVITQVGEPASMDGC